jgi:type IV pilus assembly protein PilM
MSKTVSVGLDIGSSAVRAAEVVIDGDKRTLQRFAQVGLPAGAVVEGEVRDQAVVTTALKRLWQHGRFSTKSVVVGLGSQRAMVRQVEMPPMSDSELRSALRFKIGEFLPIPVEQAVVDFSPLPGGDDSSGKRRVLLVAAQRDVALDIASVVGAAGLRVRSIDASALALLRAVAPPRGPDGNSGPGGGMEAVVGVGAQLVTVAVREGGIPRFVRTVALPEEAMVRGSAEALATVPGTPDPARRGGSPGAPGAGVDTLYLESIVGEVRSSLEYLLSQSQSQSFEHVLLTGGGAMAPGLTEALSRALSLPVNFAELGFQIDKKELGLDAQALNDASYRWLTAVGLSLWGTDAYGKASLLPAEILAKRQQQRILVGAMAGIAVVAVALAGVSVAKVNSAHDISAQIRSSQVEASSLSQKIASLGYVTKIPDEVKARQALAISALSGDISWTGLLGRIAKALPPTVTVQQIALTKTETVSASGGAWLPVSGDVVGSIQMTAVTTGGAAAVAQFIDRVSRVAGLQALWVSSTNHATGSTTMQVTAQVTTAALSARVAALPGGGK